MGIDTPFTSTISAVYDSILLIVPGYPSSHTAGAATTSTVLEYFFPADAKQFQQLAQDCADSRFYAGIHFRTDNETALKMGAALGKYIAETWMKK